MNDNNNITFEDLTGQGNGGAPVPPPIEPKKNSFNIASLVLGIVGIVAACCINEYFAIVCGIAAIVFRVMSKKQGLSDGMSTAGLICGIISICIAVLGIISNIVLLVLLETYPELSQMIESITSI